MPRCHLSGCGTRRERGDRNRNEGQGKGASCHASQPVQGPYRLQPPSVIKERLAAVPLEPAMAGVGTGSLQCGIRLLHERGGIHRALGIAGNAVVAPAHL